MRISDFTASQPEVYQALTTIGKAAAAAGLERPLIELVKLRASQINGCAYCLSFHTGMARKLDVPPAKLDLLASWRDAGVFDERERAALAWTEALTRLSEGHPGGTARAEALRVFGEAQFAALSVCVGLINLWNRVNVGLGVLPPEALPYPGQA